MFFKDYIGELIGIGYLELMDSMETVYVGVLEYCCSVSLKAELYQRTEGCNSVMLLVLPGRLIVNVL